MRGFLLLALCLIFNIYAGAQSKKDLKLDSLLLALKAPSAEPFNAKSYNLYIQQVLSNGIPRDSGQFFELLLAVYERTESGYSSKAQVAYSLGKFHVAVADSFTRAIPYFLEAISIYETAKDSAGLSKCYMQLGLIGYIMQYYEDAIKNFKLALQYAANNTAVYLMGVAYTEMEDYKKAQYYLKRALAEYRATNKQSNVSECLMYLGKLHVRAASYDSAYYYLKMAVKNLKAHKEFDKLTRASALFSEYYLARNEIDSAQYHAQKSLAIGAGSDKLSEIIAVRSLAQVFEEKRDFEQAHIYLKRYHKLSQEDLQGSTKQKIAEMQAVFSFNKQIAEEELRHQEELYLQSRTRNWAIFSGLFILLLAVGLWSRLNYVRRSQAQLKLEKNRSEELLLNILPEEIAQELKEKGKAEAQDYNEVSILFTDFKGFTELSEQLNASELVGEINHCFKAFDRIIERYGIEKIKTIGDAYMAAGGLPVPSEDSAKNTVLAALDMQEFIASRKAENEALGSFAFQMRVGIHTGPVVAGIVGLKKFQYDIWGDTVNTASRMESHGASGEVNISTVTHAILQGDPDFVFQERQELEVKGKGLMKMYFVSLKQKA